jgi:hypothetical protein
MDFQNKTCNHMCTVQRCFLVQCRKMVAISIYFLPILNKRAQYGSKIPILVWQNCYSIWLNPNNIRARICNNEICFTPSTAHLDTKISFIIYSSLSFLFHTIVYILCHLFHRPEYFQLPAGSTVWRPRHTGFICCQGSQPSFALLILQYIVVKCKH